MFLHCLNFPVCRCPVCRCRRPRSTSLITPVSIDRIAYAPPTPRQPVVCTFNVSKTHAGAQSGRCAGCARYACAPCGDLAACSCCAQTFCRACKALEPCAACGDGVCPACWAAAAEQQRCVQCPVFAKICAQCRPVGHCQVCDAHGGKGSRACDSCGGESCAVCVAESPYCRHCGEFPPPPAPLLLPLPVALPYSPAPPPRLTPGEFCMW